VTVGKLACGAEAVCALATSHRAQLSKASKVGVAPQGWREATGWAWGMTVLLFELCKARVPWWRRMGH